MSLTKYLPAVGALLFLFLPFLSKAAPRSATLDVVTFNYCNRPIYDVFIDRKSGDSSIAYPETGGSTITGVTLTTGPKTVTWTLDGKRGTPRNGETVTAKNALHLADVPRDAVFLAVHIYPDDTAGLITSRHYPRKTAKGIAMASQYTAEAPLAKSMPLYITRLQS